MESGGLDTFSGSLDDDAWGGVQGKLSPMMGEHGLFETLQEQAQREQHLLELRRMLTVPGSSHLQWHDKELATMNWSMSSSPIPMVRWQVPLRARRFMLSISQLCHMAALPALFCP